MIGIAVRSGIALGLNLQKKGIIPFDVKSNEARKQLWWSIFRLENHLSVMTGRVSCLGGVSSSTSPPPLGPILEPARSEFDQYTCEHRWTIHLEKKKMDSQRKYLKSLAPSSSLYFFYAMDLSLIVHAIANEVYAIDRSHTGWSRVEGRIDLYSKKMDYWMSTLHPSFRFQDHPGNKIPKSRSAFQISLGLNYYGACILLYRPCLSSHAAGRKAGLPTCRSRCATFSARACVQASLAVIDLLPDRPELAWPYNLLQWWDILHVLTQATVILLLDISLDPMPTILCESADPVERTGPTWSRARKGLSWLHCLGMTSEAARRAFQFMISCVRRMAPAKLLNLEGIPSSFTSFQTSADPNIPWLRDLHEKRAVTPSHDRGSSSTEPPNLVFHNEIYNDLSFQEPRDLPPSLSGFSNASVLLDAEIDLPEFISSPGAHIDDLLLSIISN
ncbi:hypothetical protein N7540_013135 [Penicillium herquei]|nr:hypothetical protein N7540_013135 [Penicillium herquei]